MPQLRPLRPADQHEVGLIAYETGFFGDSAGRYFPCQPLFARLWVGPYFRGPGLGFVAEHAGEVVGYIIGMADPLSYRRALRTEILHALAAPGCPPADVRASLSYLWRMERYGAPHADERQYPAHLHINLRPSARGLSLGEALLRAYLADLSRRGVPGVQLSTTAENRAALGLYRKMGFEVLASRTTRLWEPWLGYPTEQLVWGRLTP